MGKLVLVESSTPLKLVEKTSERFLEVVYLFVEVEEVVEIVEE